MRIATTNTNDMSESKLTQDELFKAWKRGELTRKTLGKFTRYYDLNDNLLGIFPHED